jgi:hypothetical protein
MQQRFMRKLPKIDAEESGDLVIRVFSFRINWGGWGLNELVCKRNLR